MTRLQFAKKTFFCICIYSGVSVFPTSSITEIFEKESPEVPGPWFTGPLLAPSANTIPAKHVNVEPYVYFIGSGGFYNGKGRKVETPESYSLLSQNYLQMGLTSFIDCQVVPQLFYQFTQGKKSVQAGDLPIQLGFQLLQATKQGFAPSIKLALKATIPWAKYDDLDPEKLGTDGVGSGSWIPGVGLNFGKLFKVSKTAYCSTRLSFSYTAPNPVSVKGLSVYGGGSDTKGTAYPGNSFSTDLALEYMLTQNWVFATDIYYVYNNKTRFSGYAGTSGEPGGPFSERLSLAPAIEYNWSLNVGIITGAWFTVWGRNGSSFAGSVTAVNVYF